MRLREAKLARAGRIGELRSKVGVSTLALLVEVQREFYEATRTNTIYTASMETESCDIGKAYLIRLHYFRDSTQTQPDDCLVWVAHEDLANDIARAWGYVLWGNKDEEPSDFAPWFTHVVEGQDVTIQ